WKITRTHFHPQFFLDRRKSQPATSTAALAPASEAAAIPRIVSIFFMFLFSRVFVFCFFIS
ncbi:MAG: hypothetical protein ACOYM3_21060, partial [Terrimicrobiaceae bacterium]